MAKGRALAVLCSLLAMVGLLGLQPAYANGTVGDFEIDGNLADEGGNSYIDWDTPPPNAAPIPDVSKSKADDSFGQGSKELDPGGWVCTTGGVPGKDDLKGGKIAIRTVSGKQFLYGNWFRHSPNGDAHIDYEFNQLNEQGPCPGTLKRKDGDRLITFDTENGGASIFVRAWRWEFSPGSTTSGTFIEIQPNSEHVTFDGAVNIPPSLSPPNTQQGTFGELSLNLTDTIGTITCGTFTGVSMKTRASTAINSALKDRTVAVPVPGIECPTPTLSISKSGVQNADGTLTFTITYSNSGTGAANNVVIKDQRPAGTAFVGCSDNCTQTGNTITWNIGTVAPNGGGTVSLTLSITNFPTTCQICNVARISSPQFNGGAELASLPACVTVTPVANANGAHASGTARGLFASAPGLIADTEKGTSSSSQTGPGSASDPHTELNPSVPPVVTASIINTNASSSVAVTGAVQESWAETLNANVLSGLVTASKVLGVARAFAGGSSATYGTSTGSLSSGFVDLKVDGVVYENVAPNTEIDVSDSFGSGSYVRLFWLSDNQSGLAAGVYSADVTVRMIDVHLIDRDPITPGNQPADVVVSQAVAHADFPQTPLCRPAPQQSVLGDATIARVQNTGLLDPTFVGYVFIPTTGGTSSQHLNSVVVNNTSGDPVATSGTADSFSTGSLTPTASTASSYAQVKNVCLLPSPSGCSVTATLVKAATQSSATSGGASSNPADTQVVGVTVAGIPISDPIAPDTEIVVPGVGILRLNQRFCNIGSAPACAAGGSTAMTVRAIELVLTTGVSGLPAGSVLVVAEAHSGATYI